MGFIDWSLKSSTTIFHIAVRGQRRKKLGGCRERERERLQRQRGVTKEAAVSFHVTMFSLGPLCNFSLPNISIFRRQFDALGCLLPWHMLKK